MAVFNIILISILISFVNAERVELDIKDNGQASRVGFRALRNLIREAGEFFENFTATKNATVEADSRLNEFRNALIQPNSKSSSAILLPTGWDKKTIVDTISKAVSQNRHLQELTERFDRLSIELKRLEEAGLNANVTRERSRTQDLTALLSIQPLGNLSILDNSNLMGKLVGFIRTARRLGSFSLRDLNPCSRGQCEKWKKGVESLREFFSKSKSKLSELFKNSDALRQLVDENENVHVRNNTRKFNGTRRSNGNATETKPIDYFDYYYHGEIETRKSPNRTEIKIVASRNISQSNGKRTNTDNKVVDYFDYYYNEGVPAASKKKGPK